MGPKGVKRCQSGPYGAKWAKKGADGDTRGLLGENLCKDGDCPRNGDHTFLEKATVLMIVTILRMITILVMVTIIRDGDHHKGW